MVSGFEIRQNSFHSRHDIGPLVYNDLLAVTSKWTGEKLSNPSSLPIESNYRAGYQDKYTRKPKWAMVPDITLSI